MNRNTMFKLLGILVIALLSVGVVATAQTKFYVNNSSGLDGYNGLSPTFVSTGVGPKLTIANAIAAAVNGDTISVAFTGTAYGDIVTGAKTLVFTSTAGSPTAANINVGAATVFTAPYTLAGTGTLTLTAAVTNANNITVASGGTISRGAGSVDVAPVFGGTAALIYTSTKTIGPEMPTTTTVMTNLSVTGAITVTVNRSLQMSGTLAVNNAVGILGLGGNTLTMTNTTTSPNHDVTGAVTATSAGGIVASTTTGTVTFINTGTLPSITSSATTGAVTVNGPVAISGSATASSGNLNLTTPTGATGLTGSLTNNGAGTVTVSATMTIGGNVSNTSTGVITFGNVNITVTGNVSNTGAQSNTSNTAQTANAGNINFGDGVIVISGTVTNSSTFAGTTSGTGAATGGFLTSGNINFASAATTVTITGLLTNSSASTFTTTATTSNAGVFSGSGRITFAATSGNVTLTGGVTNSSSGFTSLSGSVAPVPENGSILFSARAAASVTVGTPSAPANVANNSGNTGGTNGNIDFTAAGTGAVTVNGNVSLDASAGTGDIIIGGAGGNNTSITGTVSNARSVSGGVITVTNTTTNVAVGGITQSGAGSITLASTTGTITVTAGGAVTISSGTVSTASTTGGITLNSYTQTGGTLSAAALTTAPISVSGIFSLSAGTCDLTASGASNLTFTSDVSLTGGTLKLGAGTRTMSISGSSITVAVAVTFTGGAATTLILNRAVSAQTLTSATGVAWPGNFTIGNTFVVAPTFNLVGGNFIANGNVIFDSGGAANGVNLNNNTLFVKGSTAGAANFVNRSGYTGGPNGFVSMQGAGAQLIDGTQSFFNIEVDNAAGANFDDQYSTNTTFTFTITGTVNLTNGVVNVGTGDVISLNNVTTPPTIVRNAGSFAGAATFTSTVNVVYIGASKVMSNEIPGSGTNKLVNLTIATTGAGVVTVAVAFEFSGTLTISTGQTLDLASYVVTCNGANISSLGSWAATTGKLVLNKAAGTLVNATGALPQIDVAVGSLNNSITGATGISVGTNKHLTLTGATGSITVNFTGAGPHIVANLVTTAASTNLVTLGANTIVGGVLTHAGGTIALGAFNLTVKGNANSMEGAAAITGTGKLVFNGTTGSTFSIGTTAGTVAASVEMNLDAAGSTLTVQTQNLTIGGALTLTKGVLTLTTALTLTGNALNLTTSGSIAGAGALTFAPAAGVLTVTLAGNTTFDNLTVNGDVTLAGTTGNLTITNTLTHTTGLITFAARNLICGTFTRAAGTYAATTGVLQVNTAFTQGTGFSIPNLTTNGTFAAGSAQNFTVTGTYHALSGTFTHTVSTVARLNIAAGGTVQVTAGALDVAPVYAGAYNLTYTPAAASTVVTGVEWPATGSPGTLTINGGDAAAITQLASGTGRGVGTALVLTRGVFDLVSSARTLTLATGVAVSRTGNASITLNSGVLTFAGTVDVTYNGTVAVTATGAELPTSAIALRNLTFTRTGDVVNFLTTNGRNITVNGTLTIKNDLTTTGTITALGDITIATDTGTNPSAPQTTFTAALTFSGATNQTINLNGDRTLGNITINKTAATNTVTIAGGTLTCGGTMTFVNGLVLTGTNVLILTQGAGVQGFDRTGVSGTNISHVVGNVRKVVLGGAGALGRNEFPVGTSTVYRPAAISFGVTPGVTITVSHVDTKPTGIVGLPITDGVSPGVDIARYAPFYWSISSNVSMGQTAFNLDLTASGFADFDNIANVRIIRRIGVATDVANTWSLQGVQYDNFVAGGIPTVVNVNSTGGVRPEGGVFTYGLKSNMVIANPFTVPTLTDAAPIFRRSLRNPALITGATGALSFTVSIDNTALATVSITAAPTESLIVTRKVSGSTTVRITATDASDGSRITYSTGINVITAVETLGDNIPTEFALGQNYPNPFNPSTTIRFALPKEAPVTLVVYNMLGVPVRTLVNGENLNAANHQITWDGKDDAGLTVPSGVYLYRISAGTFQTAKKMTLLK